MKFNICEIYRDRATEIDKQIRECVHKKQWDKLGQLRSEKKKINNFLSGEVDIHEDGGHSKYGSRCSNKEVY